MGMNNYTMKLSWGKFRLDIRKKFTQKVVEHWNRLPRVTALNVTESKKLLGNTLRHRV